MYGLLIFGWIPFAFVTARLLWRRAPYVKADRDDQEWYVRLWLGLWVLAYLVGVSLVGWKFPEIRG